MQWKIRGANRQTGADVEFSVDAATQEEAIKKAGATGMLIAEIVPMIPPIPPNAQAEVEETTTRLKRIVFPERNSVTLYLHTRGTRKRIELHVADEFAVFASVVTLDKAKLAELRDALDLAGTKLD